MGWYLAAVSQNPNNKEKSEQEDYLFLNYKSNNVSYSVQIPVVPNELATKNLAFISGEPLHKASHLSMEIIWK